MDVQLTPDQAALAHQAIESGRLRGEEDAVREALSLWEARERTRAEILAEIDDAELSVAQGQALEFTAESVRDIAAGVKQRGRVRLAAEYQTKR